MADTSSELMHFSEEFQRMVDEYFLVQCRYQAALREVQTKLEALNLEFETMHHRNPIHHMESRMKTLQSIVGKLHRKNMDISISSAMENLYDIAGIRVVCSYIQDVFQMADLLTAQDDIRVVRINDYIHHPKANGYRSLHLVIEVPVYLSEGRLLVLVEVQLRTIAMDFWASLEHNLRYKSDEHVPQEISEELLKTAGDIAQIDERMQAIHDQMDRLHLNTPRHLPTLEES